MPSPTWNIAFGDYDLRVDRRALTLDLTETKTGTVWGTGVPLGWIEVEERASGNVTRHDFGSLRQITVSEKAGPQGKRILFGLDLDGLPVDVYLICSQREVQMVVEASRDTKTHRVHGFGLVPGLCHVPDDKASYLVLPLDEGAFLRADGVPPSQWHRSVWQTHTPQGWSDQPVQSRPGTVTMQRPVSIPSDTLDFPVWDSVSGVIMPFVGAVNRATNAALGLITDSAYGVFQVMRHGAGVGVFPAFSRDPERRRLDVRLVPLPGGDHVSIARTYREKLIGDNNHVTLRRKLRDRPQIDGVIGAALVQEPMPLTETTLLVLDREDYDTTEPEAPQALSIAGLGGALNHRETQSRWEDMDKRLQAFASTAAEIPIVGCNGGGDWVCAAADFWRVLNEGNHRVSGKLPLAAVVYHDCVVMPILEPNWSTKTFLRAILNLSPPWFFGASRVGDEAERNVEQIAALLCPLHRLAFSAFLTAHRFLTSDYLTEEAIYSDKTRVVINQSETDNYENDDLILPPQGFYVRHAQMEAHHALRVGSEEFDEQKYRMRRAMDGEPLEQSSDVRRQEWDLPSFPVAEDETNLLEDPFQE